jgi:cell division protein FtsI/penicillin-binding protein 2
VRSGGDELAAAVDAFATGLSVEEWVVERGPAEVDGGSATAPGTVTLVTADVGDVTWETTLRASRVRGEWGVEATTDTWHPDWRPGLRVVVERTDVTRAPILDRDDEPLTSHGTSRTVGVAPGRVVNEERLLEAWAATLPESLEDLQELLGRSDLQPDWYYPVVTVGQGRYDDVWPQLRVVPGVLSRDAADASPTSGDLAVHVLGRVDRPTAEQAADLGVPADATVGLNGLERVFEDRLVGSAEARALLVEADGDEVAELATAQDDPSGPVSTTLDRTVQEAVENALSGVGGNVAVVAVDATDGAIRASASRPLGGYNRAWEGNYPPGDAFLPVAGEALLAGGMALDDPVACPARDAVVGAAFDAPTPLGDTTAVEALAAGCDPSLATLAADTLETDDLRAAAERFGFGVAPDLPLPAATADLPPPIDTTELVRAANGQARVLASPLHVASLWGAAADGTWHAPYLLRDADGERASADLAAPAVTPLRELVAAGGRSPGSAAGFAELGAGGAVGTAPVTGGDAEHAWAAGVVGLDGDTPLAFAVLVEDTGGDPGPARSIAERFLRELQALRAAG